MTTAHFIEQAIGELVYISEIYDYKRRSLFDNKTPLRLIKLTKGGYAYLHDENTDMYYSIKPTIIREYSELNIDDEIK